MHPGEAFVGDLQLDAAGRVGLEQVDELPRDDARRNALEQRPQRERGHDAFGQAADRATRADIDRHHVQQHVAVDRRRFELDVVDADDLAAVDVDDLLIEEVALEQENAVRRVVRRPAASIRSSVRTVPPHDFRSSADRARSPPGVPTIRYAMRVG